MTEQLTPKFKIGEIVWFVEENIGIETYALRYMKIETITIEQDTVHYKGNTTYVHADLIYDGRVNENDIFCNIEEALLDVKIHMEIIEEKCHEKDAQLRIEKNHIAKIEAEARAQGKTE